MMDYFQILCGIAVLLLSIYYYFSSTYDYWKKRDIPGPQPKIIIGNFTDVILRRLSIGDTLIKFYNEYKNEPVFGLFEGSSPVLVINNMDMIKDVLIKDFSVFVDRGFRIFPKIEKLGENLFLLEPERWRPMRAKLSPIFTSGKLKDMFPLLIECAGHLEKYMDSVIITEESTDCRELTAKFTTDVIGSCVFGININALSEEESEFRRMGRKLFAPSFKQVIRETFRQFMPYLYEIFGQYLQPKEVDNFFVNVVKDTMNYRKENNIVRPDFIHMLMELKKHPGKLEKIELTDTLLTSQAFVFFSAGFETSSSTMAHALYELAQNHEIQDKVQEEIRESFEKHGKTITYEQVKEMKYLDKVVKETLRKYPILPMLTRKATEDYTFKNSKITIKKDTVVWLPTLPIQRDPDIFPNPDVFDPERFNDDAVAARHPMSYLPFGDGPRNCIGSRFANYQTRVGLITILRNYKVDVCEKTVIPYKSDPLTFMMSLKGGVHLKITKA